MKRELTVSYPLGETEGWDRIILPVIIMYYAGFAFYHGEETTTVFIVDELNLIEAQKMTKDNGRQRADVHWRAIWVGSWAFGAACLSGSCAPGRGSQGTEAVSTLR